MDALRDLLGLFGAAYGTALLLAALLPCLGVVLVLRQRVFTAAAVAQSAALGFAVGSAFGLGEDHAGHGPCGPELLLLGGAFGALAGLFAMQRARTAGAGLETWAAVLFLFGGSASMLLLSDAPHGLQEVQRLQLSSILGATPVDLLVALGLALATATLLALRGSRVLLVASDEATAEVLGLSVRAWRNGLGLWIGVCLSFAIHATGLLFAFSCTVLPVLCVREWAPSLRVVLWAAPLVSVVSVAVSIAIAQTESLDWPPGQTSVAVQAGLVAVAGLVRGRSRG